MPRTGIAPCPACSELVITAVLLDGGTPVTIDRYPDQQGVIAAQHTALGAWHARRLPPGVAFDVTEHRYAIHECGAETDADAAGDVTGIGAWKQARAEHSRQQRSARGRRTPPGVTGTRWAGRR